MVMKSKEFIEKLKDIANNYKTLYVMGCFGAPLNAANKTRYTTNHSYNKQPARVNMINSATDDTFGFDCVNLIKGVLWGWCGNKSKTYGGASYASNGVPDIDANVMITRCTSVSNTGWSSMVPGEAVWMTGHIGVYIGNGLAIECTPSWKNNVQITAVGNIGSKAGYNSRKWTKHGKLPWIDYSDQNSSGTSSSNNNASTGSNTTDINSLLNKTVNFAGTVHYANASAASGTQCKPGKATVTQVYPNGKHPVHLKAVSGGGSTVYGWVDLCDVSVNVVNTVTGTPSTGTESDEKKIYDYLMSKIGNAYGVCGLMGNIYAESGLRSNNMQNSYESKLGYNDTTYTSATDTGTYTNFVKDAVGYGLCQWTYWSRKQNLLNYAQRVNKSIGDCNMQLDFLIKELGESFSAVLNTLKTATTIRQASDSVLVNFERPADMSESVKVKRCEYGQKYYDKYVGTTSQPSTDDVTDINSLLNKTVNFTGTMHYANANATTGVACKPGKATVTQVYPNGKHPVHLKAVSGGGSTVYGWVDLCNISGATSNLPRNVQVTASALNVRSGPGTNYSVAQCIRDRGVYQIIDEENGFGKLSTGGWISLQYTKDV